MNEEKIPLVQVNHGYFNTYIYSILFPHSKSIEEFSRPYYDIPQNFLEYMKESDNILNSAKSRGFFFGLVPIYCNYTISFTYIAKE